jgi:hypothetical protein
VLEVAQDLRRRLERDQVAQPLVDREQREALAAALGEERRVESLAREAGDQEMAVVHQAVAHPGFREIGPEGAALEEQLIALARRTGIRVFGPNCQGIINTDPTVRAYCNFTFTRPSPGHISIVAQSGGVGEVIHQELGRDAPPLLFFRSAYAEAEGTDRLHLGTRAKR